MHSKQDQVSLLIVPLTVFCCGVAVTVPLSNLTHHSPRKDYFRLPRATKQPAITLANEENVSEDGAKTSFKHISYSFTSTIYSVSFSHIEIKNNTQQQFVDVDIKTAGRFPDSDPDQRVNLTFLPMLAFIFFIFGVCIKCYTWMRDTDRKKARGTLDFEDDEVNYSIITAGEQGYREIDFRSDNMSLYDTVTSFRSLPNNDCTITSVRSLPNQPYESIRSILLQKPDGGVYDTVQSYKAFLEKAIEANDVDIEVELVNNYKPKLNKSFDKLDSKSEKRRIHCHSGERSLECNDKSQAEKKRVRRHSEKIPILCASTDSLRSKQLYRRSSPAIFKPLTASAISEFKTDLLANENPCILHQRTFTRMSTNSSSESHSSSDSQKSMVLSKNPQRKKTRHKQKSQETIKKSKISDDKVKSSSHSSGHSSDESPRSSSSSKQSSSNELESDSDVTDSGFVVDSLSQTTQSFVRSEFHSTDSTDISAKRVHRFKVSFIDDALLCEGSIPLKGKQRNSCSPPKNSKAGADIDIE